ncbi:MAG: M28 family peptidase [Bacteroidales bacterium]
MKHLFHSGRGRKIQLWFDYSFHQYKLHNALKHGAAGMIYNYGPIANPNNAYDPGFIYLHVGDSVVKDIFAGTGRSHDQVVRSIEEKLKPASFETGKTVTVTMSTTHITGGRGANIIGLLPGTDPQLKDEVIIIGAHLDHMGRCYDIIPGANDNASAVAVMMGVAKALYESRIPLGRSVLFIAFGSEEQGILGSKAYLENPPFDLKRSVLINMDGVGVGDRISINSGKDFPLLYKPFEEMNSKYVHRTLSPNSFSNLGRPRLDAARFLTAGIPSLSFATYGSTSYYHVPPDKYI